MRENEITNEKKEFKYYDLDYIDKENCLFNIIFGERSNGKSYQIKLKKMFKVYMETGDRFILMRRWKDEVKSYKVEQYFNDINISDITNGLYNTITVYRNRIYMSYYDMEENKITKRGEHVGYVIALATEQSYAGASYLDVSNIIFEEFMSRSVYCPDEFNKLMNLYCTVDRKRGTTKLWLVGNTLTRVCPYFDGFNIRRIVMRQKQGTIYKQRIIIDDVDQIITIAVEHTEFSGRGSFVLGTHADTLNTGSWQYDPQPLISISKKECYINLRVIFYYKEFYFIAELLTDTKGNTFWFIYPRTTNLVLRDKDILIFSDKHNIKNNYFASPYAIANTRYSSMLQKINILMQDTFIEGNIFYSDNMCGTEFKQSIDFKIRR